MADLQVKNSLQNVNFDFRHARLKLYIIKSKTTFATSLFVYLKLPNYFQTEIASDALKGRVFEVSLADLQDDEVTYRKFKLMVEDVQGKQCLTNFHGLDMTTDKLRSLVKKWQVRFHILYCPNKWKKCINTKSMNKL